MTLHELVATHRANMERAGIRGIDLDYILDERVDHDKVIEPFLAVVRVQLERWLYVRSKCTEDQWAYYAAACPDMQEMKTIRKATRDLIAAYKKTVLVYFKEAEKRVPRAKQSG